MKQKTNTRQHDLHPTVCDDCSEKALVVQDVTQTSRDLRNALLIVSATINVFVFTAWLMMQASVSYAAQITNFLAAK